MSPADWSDERHFQNDIIKAMVHNGWICNRDFIYDRELALIPQDVIAFVRESQPEAWKKLREKYPKDYEQKLIEQVATRLKKADPHVSNEELRSFGTLGVLRRSLRHHNLDIKVCAFKPENDLNEEALKGYQANILRIVPELVYSPWATKAQLQETGQKAKRWRIDLVLFVNGIPVVTMELKSEFKQAIDAAVEQYKTTRLPQDPATKKPEPLLSFKRGALVHFAVSQYEVRMTTHLRGDNTFFLPFNRGTKDGGAGNDTPEDIHRYATEYLWQEILLPANLLEILGRFIHLQIEQEEDWQGLKYRKEKLIFPRYHQWQAVKRLMRTLKDEGAGHKYLIQHSAGSGKSNSIGWLAHQLSTLPDAKGNEYFASVIVITDRTVLDAQLQDTVEQLGLVKGVVKRIERKSALGSKSQQLADALTGRERIIIVTIQTFPFVLDAIEEEVSLRERRFAIIADEAHSSQTGQTARRMREVLLKESSDQEHDEAEDQLTATLKARRISPNLSYFAFTATPKAKTLQLFGRCPDPSQPPSKTNIPEPFDVYSMRQAIEEGFILDVLKSYTNYKVAYQLGLKAEANDERVESKRAKLKLNQWVRLHGHNVAQKAKVIVEHFRDNVFALLNGNAKAMVVTSSRKEAVLYKHKIDSYIAERGYHKIHSMVAFSGEVSFSSKDPEAAGLLGQKYTERNMNPDLKGRDLRKAFDSRDFDLLIVANKFQTGFDQPKLCAMYVDKKLAGVECVQTLSRLNRTYQGKSELGTFIIDFVNEPEDIKNAFLPFYKTAELADVSDPDQIFEIYDKVCGEGIFLLHEVEQFHTVYEQMIRAGQIKASQRRNPALSNICKPAMERWSKRYQETVQRCEATKELYERTKQTGDPVLMANAESAYKESKEDLSRLAMFKKDLGSFIRLYEFLSMLVDYEAQDLEKLNLYARHLLPLLREGKIEEADIDLSDVTLSHYRLSRIRQQQIRLEASDEDHRLQPGKHIGSSRPQDKREDLLSRIITRLNSIFGIDDLTDGDKRDFFMTISNKVGENEPVRSQMANNTKEQAKLGDFMEVLEDAVMECEEAHENMREQLIDPEKFQQFGNIIFDYLYDLAQNKDNIRSLWRPAQPSSRIVTNPPAAKQFKTCVPLVDIEAAAGAFSESQDSGLACLQEATRWVTLPNRQGEPNMFAARVVGRSMEPAIPSGSICLFGPVPAGSKNGLPLLILLHEQTDPEHGGRYTVKNYRSEKQESEDGQISNTRIILEPKNPEFDPLIFTQDQSEGLRAIGRFLEVLNVAEIDEG
jgi:type I restriction enzyme R subunit